MARPVVKPNVVDRAIAFFDPIRGAERHRARMMLALTGGYTGAKRDRRATSEWKAGGGSADADLLPDLPLLRERSRDLARNAPLAGGAVSTVVTNVVGTGLDPQSQIDRDVLELEDDAADEWQRAAEREWWLWAGSQECDITRTQDFCGLQDMIFRAVLESGDALVLKRYVERPGSPYGLKLQVIEGDRIQNPDYRADQSQLPSGNRVCGGVESDRDGAPLAYHVARAHPGDLRFGAVVTGWDRVAAFGEATGERAAFHLYRRLRPNQTRGVPYLAIAVEPFKQLSRYTESELMAAVVASFFTVFTKTEAAEGLNTASPTAETGGSASDEDYKLAPGAILDLAPGEDVEFANPMRPNAAFDGFVLAICRQIGAGLEIPYEILVKHFTSSYSASRAAMLEAWKFFRSRRQWLVGSFCQPIYDAVITEAVARGRLDAPGFFEDALLRQAWLGTKWTGPPAGQIDPEAEINAARKRLALGVSTYSQETAELTGGDFETNVKQLGKERSLREAAGLVPDPTVDTAGAAQTANPPPAPGDGPTPKPDQKQQQEAARASRSRSA